MRLIGKPLALLYVPENAAVAHSIEADNRFAGSRKNCVEPPPSVKVVNFECLKKTQISEKIKYFPYTINKTMGNIMAQSGV